jgi:hypothetical protein
MSLDKKIFFYSEKTVSAQACAETLIKIHDLVLPADNDEWGAYILGNVYEYFCKDPLKSSTIYVKTVLERSLCGD